MMNTREFKAYKKKWEGLKKEIFTSLSNGDHKAAFIKLDEVKNDEDFYKIPHYPDEIAAMPDSPINELLNLLIHKKIFFTIPKPTETIIEEIKANKAVQLNEEEQKFIDEVSKAIFEQKQEKITEAIMNGENPADIKPINIPNMIPHFPLERTDALPFIEKLIELGADPYVKIGKNPEVYKKMLGLDSESLTKYVLKKVDDKKLFEYDDTGGDYLCHILKSRATKSFFIFVKDKEKVIDFDKVYPLSYNQNLLHHAMGHYLQDETYFLVGKNVSLVQRNTSGLYPADLIPNMEIAEALEESKAAIREKSDILTSPISKLFIPNGFKPQASISHNPDEFYEDMRNKTVHMIELKREKSLKNIEKYRTAF